MDAAVDNSVLVTDPNVLPNLGLKPFASNQLFPHTDLRRLEDEFTDGVSGTKGTIPALFRLGALVEDDGTRAINHFFDPISGLAANVFGTEGVPYVFPTITSPSWALEDRSEIGEQSYSFKDARNYMYIALTYPNAAAREANWGQTFRSLGEVVHHIQDMAQPQHVRNDLHCDIGIIECKGLYNPSKYEAYGNNANRTNDAVIANIKRLARNAQAAAVYPGPAEFKTARDFWKNAAGSGLAEFTNRNFVSQGTNFRMYQGQASTTGYQSPRPGAPKPYTIDELYAAQGTSVPTGILNLCSTAGVNCKMMMYPTPLTPKASTLSIFDQDMQAKGLRVVYNDSDGTSIYYADRLFALNRFNFDAAHETLIPKAVSYSAGLINYFFRGSFKIELPALGAYAVADHATAAGFTTVKALVTNTTPNEAMTNGTLVAVAKFHRNNCYQPDLSGEFIEDAAGNSTAPCPNYRTAEEFIVVSSPQPLLSLAADAQSELTFTFTDPIPMNATDLFLQVVYRGKLGEELDAVAVGTVDIAEPTFVTVMNNTDLFVLEDTYYYYQDIIDNITQFPFNIIDIDNNGKYNLPADIKVEGGDINFEVFLSGGKVADINPIPQGRFARLALLVNPSTFTLRLYARGAGFNQPDSYQVLPKISQVDSLTGKFVPSTVIKARSQAMLWFGLVYNRFYPTNRNQYLTMPVSKAVDAITPVPVQLVAP